MVFLYKELQKVDPDVKVCFLTASEKYREGLREGEYQTLSKDLFIQKPLSIKDLRKEIHKRIGLNKKKEKCGYSYGRASDID